MARRGNVATLIGLCVALLGPAVLALLSKELFGARLSLGAALLAELVLVLICVFVLAIVFRWERLPLSSVGIQPLCLQSLTWGCAFAAFLIWVYSPLLAWAMAFAGIPWFTEGLETPATYPGWYLMLAITVGGAAEELLYRGYAVERLATLTGSCWIAGLISVLVFGVAHVPMWGWAAALTTLVSGAILTVFYVWRRDLLANVIAHVATDFVGIVLPFLLARK